MPAGVFLRAQLQGAEPLPLRAEAVLAARIDMQAHACLGAAAVAEGKYLVVNLYGLMAAALVDVVAGCQ